MAGITSMGVYIPMYRLKHDEIARMDMMKTRSPWQWLLPVNA
jgi:3-hydroxy-3-methylglutaryl CoA synthase